MGSKNCSIFNQKKKEQEKFVDFIQKEKKKYFDEQKSQNSQKQSDSEEKYKQIIASLEQFENENQGFSYISELIKEIQHKKKKIKFNSFDFYGAWIAISVSMEPDFLKINNGGKPKKRLTEHDIEVKSQLHLSNASYSHLPRSKLQQNNNSSYFMNNTMVNKSQFILETSKIEPQQKKNQIKNNSNLFSENIYNTSILQENKVEDPVESTQSKYIFRMFKYIQQHMRKKNSIMKIILNKYTEIFEGKYSFQNDYPVSEQGLLSSQLEYLNDAFKNDIKLLKQLLKNVFLIQYKPFLRKTLFQIDRQYLGTQIDNLILRFIFNKDDLRKVIQRHIEMANFNHVKTINEKLSLLKNVQTSNEYLQIPVPLQLIHEASPYRVVISQIEQLQTVSSPIMKFELLGQIKKSLMVCLEEYEKQHNTPTLKHIKGIEEYICIFKYCIIQQNLKGKLLEELEFIDTYIPGTVLTNCDDNTTIYTFLMARMKDILQDDPQNYLNHNNNNKLSQINSECEDYSSSNPSRLKGLSQISQISNQQQQILM